MSPGIHFLNIIEFVRNANDFVWKDPLKQKGGIVISSIFDWAHTMYGKLLDLSVKSNSNGEQSQNPPIFLAIVWTCYKNCLLWVLGPWVFQTIRSINDWIAFLGKPDTHVRDEMQLNLVNCFFIGAACQCWDMEMWALVDVKPELGLPFVLKDHFQVPLSFFQSELSEKFLFR